MPKQYVEWFNYICSHCRTDKPQDFFRDTTYTESFRCRQCGQEHYPDIINPKKLVDPVVEKRFRI